MSTPRSCGGARKGPMLLSGDFHRPGDVKTAWIPRRPARALSGSRGKSETELQRRANNADNNQFPRRPRRGRLWRFCRRSCAQSAGSSSAGRSGRAIPEHAGRLR
jgi:hypothetical protein